MSASAAEEELNKQASRQAVTQCRGCQEGCSKQTWHSKAYSAVRELACGHCTKVVCVPEMPLLRKVGREVQTIDRQHTDMLLVKWGGQNVLAVELDGQSHSKPRRRARGGKGKGKESQEQAVCSVEARDDKKDRDIGELGWLQLRLSHLQWNEDMGCPQQRWAAHFKDLLDQM